jgi:signal transduction histidine kinase
LNEWLITEQSRRGLVDTKQAKHIRSLADRIKESGYKISDIAETVTSIIIDELPTSMCAMWIIDHDKGLFSIEAQIGMKNKFSQPIFSSDPLIQHLMVSQRVLVKAEAERFLPPEIYGSIAKTFAIAEAEVCAPLMVLDQIAGFVFLGPKKDSRPYFVSEINEINSIVAETATAVRYVLAVSKAASQTKNWAHTLNQSLKPLSQAFDFLERRELARSPDPNAAEVFRRIKRPLKRLSEFLYYLTHQSRIVDEFLRNRYKLLPLSISDVVKKGISMHQMSIDRMNVNLTVDLEEIDQQIHGHKEDLISVFEILLGNGVRYVPDRGHITITGRTSAEMYKIIVENDGPPISEENIGNIFNEGFQVKDGMEGAAGLGLANAKRILNIHGGEIRAENIGNSSGVRFILELPLHKVSLKNEVVPKPQSPINA